MAPPLSKKKPLGYFQFTVDATTAEDLSQVTIPEGATWALLVPSAAIRWRDDGSAPTSAVGMPLAAGGSLEFDSDLRKLKLISQSGNADINVALYGQG